MSGVKVAGARIVVRQWRGPMGVLLRTLAVIRITGRWIG
jgi:hypothetical protein